MSPKYKKGSYSYFEKYSPIESDPSIPQEDKELYMSEW